MEPVYYSSFAVSAYILGKHMQSDQTSQQTTSKAIDPFLFSHTTNAEQKASFSPKGYLKQFILSTVFPNQSLYNMIACVPVRSATLGFHKTFASL